MKIVETDLEIQREPFVRPFAFKGSAFHEKWNMVVRVVDEMGNEAVGVGGLAVLWSDANVFAAHSETGGNLLQASLLEFALQRVKELEDASPEAAFDALLPEVIEFGKRVTGRQDLRTTFALISMVALDNALWLLKAGRDSAATFDDLIPEAVRPALSARQEALVLAPAVGYTLPIEDVASMLVSGVGVLKVKIGHPGTEAEMLEGDCRQLSRLHEIAAGVETPLTESGQVQYYLDANGRYRNRETMARLLDHADTLNALDRILMVEEPFCEGAEFDVGDLPARFAADESLYDLEDLTRRASQGFGAVAIKPAGKTLTLAFRMVAHAAKLGLPAFVADNACVPVLLEWNKNVSARLPSFPGIRGGVIESNGSENYGRWEEMLSEFPVRGADWLRPEAGAFRLTEAYFAQSGGIFSEPAAYSQLLRRP
jgi:hypothetical protein